MIIWLDAQLSPSIARWLTATFSIEALAVDDIGLRYAGDREIYLAAREAGAVVMTKDRDFLFLQDVLGPPPQVIWITCGNTSNAYLKGLCESTIPIALRLLDQGEPVVEIGDAK